MMLLLRVNVNCCFAEGLYRLGIEDVLLMSVYRSMVEERTGAL